MKRSSPVGAWFRRAIAFASLPAILLSSHLARADASITAPLPPGLVDVGVDEHLGAAVPLDLAFRDHTGARVHLSTFVDHRRPVVINLMYHRCTMLCSLVLDGLADALTKVEWSVGKEFDVVTVSIDPHDTPDVAARKRRQILERYGRADADHGWHFVIGDEPEITRLADALGFRYRWDAEQKQYAHPAAIFLLTPDGNVARYLYGMEFSPRDLRFGLLEASQGRGVSTVERVLLYCFHYDATGRRYTIVVDRVMHVGGVVLLGLVGGMLTVLWRRERRARPLQP